MYKIFYICTLFYILHRIQNDNIFLLLSEFGKYLQCNCIMKYEIVVCLVCSFMLKCTDV